MKKIIHLFLLITFVSCVRYDETFLSEPLSYLDVKPMSTSSDIPTINIRVNPEEFQDIHDNFLDDREINALISFYRNEELVESDILSEIKIKGSSSAQLALKSLGVKFDKTIGNEEGNIISPDEIFARHSLEKLKTIRLRNSGNDFYFTMLKHVCYIEMAIQAGLNLDLNYCEQVVVFVNDEFHGIMNINSEVNANGLSRLYDIDKNTITLAKVNSPGEITLKDGSQEELNDLLRKIKNKDAQYLLGIIDQDNLIDYLLFQTFTANMDWPYNNVRFYSINGGKWRFCLYDLDRVNWQYLHRDRDWFVESIKDNTMSDLFKLLLENENFKNKYNDRYEELINSGKFDPANFSEILTRKSKNIEGVMPLHIQKYGMPSTMTEWYFNLEELNANYKTRHSFLTSNLSR